MISYFVIYLFIIVDLVVLSIFYTVSWIKYKRRMNDKLFSVVGILLAISYFLFNLEFLELKTKTHQLVVDLAIALYLAFFFIKSIMKEINNKK